MNLNCNSVKIAKKMLKKENKLQISSENIGGATVIDCGINVKGSLDAGIDFVKACMGDLAEVELFMGDNDFQHVKVSTEHPALSCFGSQKAGWQVSEGNYFALASGPARILAKKPKETYENLGYSEKSDEALLALEAGTYPPPTLIENIADSCNIITDNLYILIAKTASIVSSIQISARAAETGLFKLNYLGYDINNIKHVSGEAPIAPIVGDDALMMGVTNDMIIYGSIVHFKSSVDAKVDEIPSINSPGYGKPFRDIFKEANYDFYKIDKGIFSPAKVYFNNTKTGKITKSGSINYEIIKRSLEAQFS
tara:strand:- start:3565 stop:4494 length:930 start_codon:yes stop_codon:yes gene_type:complete